MAKSPSAEIGQKRYYHSRYDGGFCGCAAGFDPECRYTFPSVTTILKSLPTPWLGAWAAKSVAQAALDGLDELADMLARQGRDATERYLKAAPWRHRDAAGERGTAVHAAAEAGTASEDVPEAARARVLAWHRWLDDYTPDIIWQEGTVYNPSYGYAGTFDMILRLATYACHQRESGCSWLIDIKTGFCPTLEQRLQQGAYRFAEFIGDKHGNPFSPMPKVDHVGILGLRDDGYTFYEIKAGEQEFDAFLLVKDIGDAIAHLDPEKARVVGTAKVA